MRKLCLLSLSLAALSAAGTEKLPEGLSSSDWNSIQAEYERNRHAVVPAGNEYHARSPRHQWLTRFDGRGFTVQPDHAPWQWGLELESYGHAGHERVVKGPARIVTGKQRVTYTWDRTVEEWFINDTAGLEHGFTLRQRPDGAGTGLLTMQLAVRGGLRPRVQADGNAVTFTDAEGRTVLDYAGLKVWDAAGKHLPAHLEATGDRLRLSVDEQAARYPITIDPVVQQAYLKSSNIRATDRFGFAVAISGDTVAVGVPVREEGEVYVFVRSGGTWSEQGHLKASNPDREDSFGSSVAISGDTLVVGAHGESSNATGVDGDQGNNEAWNSGAAYVFVRTGSTWSQQAYLKASNTGEGDQFGESVAVSGDTVVVGAPIERSNATGIDGPQDNDNAFGSGAAYVFLRTGSIWNQQAYLKASNTGEGDHFGESVAISGNTLVVGAIEEDSSAIGVNGSSNDDRTNSGAAYVFVRNGDQWSQQAYLKASNTGTDDEFGSSVTVSGDTVVVGAPSEASKATGVNGNQRDDSAIDSGAAYVFVRTQSNWSQQAYLKASNAEGGDRFGVPVSVSGNTVVVGAAREESNAKGVNGNQSDNSADRAGAAYVFKRTGTTWKQQAYLKASNTDPRDQFGVAVAISANTVVAGAQNEDSGFGGDDSDNSKVDAGAAYVFVLPCTVSLSLSPNVLWPPDRRLVEVTAALSIEDCGPNPTVKLISIKSNEKDSGLEPGDLPTDIQQATLGANDRKFLLRAERYSKRPSNVIVNTGRIYTVTYDVTDSSSGSTKRVTGQVKVPFSSPN